MSREEDRRPASAGRLSFCSVSYADDSGNQASFLAGDSDTELVGRLGKLIVLIFQLV